MGRYDQLTQLAPKPPQQRPPVQRPASPQIGLPESPQTRKPESGQTDKPVNGFDGKPANPQMVTSPLEQVEKYTTRLKPSMIRRIKVYAAQQDMNDYDVVANALLEYFERKEK